MQNLRTRILIAILRTAKRLKQLGRSYLNRFYMRCFPDRWYEERLKQDFKKARHKALEISIPEKPFLAIETTNICNLNCIMCDTASTTRPKGFMSMIDFIRCLDEVEKIGQGVVSFHTIGDPTTDKNMGAQLQACYERGIEVNLRTNGIILDRFFDALVKWPPGSLHFSIDGATKETYERIRVGGKFEKLLSNLKKLTELYKKHRVLCELGVDVVVCDENLNEIPLFYKVFSPFFELQHMHFHAVSSLSADLGKHYDKESLSIFSEPMFPCSMPFKSLVILHDLKVSACCRDYHGDLIVGDLRRETIEEIWRGSEIEKLRDSHRKSNEDVSGLPRACRSCYDPIEFRIQFDAFVHYTLEKYVRRGRSRFDMDTITKEVLTFVESERAKARKAGAAGKCQQTCNSCL